MREGDEMGNDSRHTALCGSDGGGAGADGDAAKLPLLLKGSSLWLRQAPSAAQSGKGARQRDSFTHERPSPSEVSRGPASATIRIVSGRVCASYHQSHCQKPFAP
jgi:hypothetical protein